MIPACWPQHPHLVHEIAVLADQRRRAGHALTSDALEEWHRHNLPAFTERMKSRLRNHCEDGHQTWPAKGRYTRYTAEISRRTREDNFAADIGAVRPPEAKGGRSPRLGLVDLDTSRPLQDQDPTKSGLYGFRGLPATLGSTASLASLKGSAANG